MMHERLGRSGLDASQIFLGTMMFGGWADQRESNAVIPPARAASVIFIDPAHSYNSDRSEEIVGKAIATTLGDWALATKAGNPIGEGRTRQGLGRRWLTLACEESLKRLRIDWIDLFYPHLEDHETPLEETVGAVRDLIASSKIRHLGVSNFRAWRIAEICHLCDRMGAPWFIAFQSYYNALKPKQEIEALPTSVYYGIGVVACSPPARGVLTGKYRPSEPAPEGSRITAADARMLESEWRPESLAIAQKLQTHTTARGFDAFDFALAWLLANRFVTCVLAGPCTQERAAAYLKALDYPYDEEDDRLLDALAPNGHPSTPSYSDPRYPIEGRAPRRSSPPEKKP